MSSRALAAAAALLLCAIAPPEICTAQDGPFGDFRPPNPTGEYFEHDETVFVNDLAGPRFGATFSPDGRALSQFGWHFESQAAPGSRGPWFIVEKVWLVSGIEHGHFLPSGTLVFGMRTPSGFEFGVGPSARFGSDGISTALVLAAGQTFRMGGIRVPVNVACALGDEGEPRISLLTGWAIREASTSRSSRQASWSAGCVR